MENMDRETKRIVDSIVNEAMSYTEAIWDRLDGTPEEEEARLIAIDELQAWLIARKVNPGELNSD